MTASKVSRLKATDERMSAVESFIVSFPFRVDVNVCCWDEV